MKHSDTISIFSKRLLELRKNRRWSQADVAKQIDTTAPIVGRYERGEMAPSIEVARKIAEAFGVSLDYLLDENAGDGVLRERKMIDRWKNLDALEKSERERILSVVDSLIRDAQARRTYAE